LETVAVQKVAESTGIAAEDLEVLASAPAYYPLSGVQAVAFKMASKVDGILYAVTLTPDGEMVDDEALTAAEAAAREAQYGKVDAELAAVLAGASAGEAVDVFVWVKTPEYEPPARPAAEADAVAAEVDQAMAAADAQWTAFVTAATAGTAARMAGLGLAVDADAYVPVVRSLLTAAQVAEVASWAEVDRVYFAPIAFAESEEAPERTEPEAVEMEVARTTTYVHTVHQRNILGFGIKIGQTEVGGRVTTSNPFLDLYDPDRVVNNNSNVCASASTHSTGVAGIQVSSHPTRFGIAPGARLYTAGSCTGSTTQLQSAATNAVNWGARAINNSWGSLPAVNKPGALDKFFDAIVYNNWRVTVKSAGNRGTGDGRITTPGLGYNIITVGNFDDRNTISWTDDIMAASSSFVNPLSTNNDRVKPEIAAPGSNINSTTTASPWTGGIGSGTSYAAPMVTGAVALLMQRDAALRSWPEAVKAILMASAVHNIEGAARLSEKDGAGALHMAYADNVARRTAGNWGAQNYVCNTVSPLIVNMDLVANKHTRAVIVWGQNPNYGDYDLLSSADLDIRVRDPSNVAVASSLSWDNTYEIVDFMPSMSGRYRLEIHRTRCILAPNYLGWAWWRVP
jgi:hypothetical protein